MNKTALKNFAIAARLELLQRVTDRAALYGIDESASKSRSIAPSNVFHKVGGAVLTAQESAQRSALVQRVYRAGFRQTMEEVAYTWFNRFIALKYMQQHNLLPVGMHVLPDAPGQQPQMLRQAQEVSLSGADMGQVLAMLDANQTDALYKYLLIALCNELSVPLPRMFETISDYTELLFPDGLLKADSVLGQMAQLENDCWDEIQVIGWLYQYYISQRHDEVVDINGSAIAKEDIPAASCLYTTEWVVRYMVENSVGRLWLEGHPNDTLRAKWRYYMDEAPQEPPVAARLAELRKPCAAMQPEQLTVLDPCMGSGHILVYAFDVLMDIYRSVGYTDRDAAQSIVAHNLYGLDIDDRAAQLAYFAVMMKACEYDRRFLRRGVQPNVCPIAESMELDAHQLSAFGAEQPLAQRLLNTFVNAKEYGSILHVDITAEELRRLRTWLTALQQAAETSLIGLADSQTIATIEPLLLQAENLTRKYDAVVTNPPYMGSSGMNDRLARFVKDNYPDSKSDLFAVFIERAGELAKEAGYQAMITQHAWMFLSSYEKLRGRLQCKELLNMAHLGARAFEEIGGEVVQTTAFIMAQAHAPGYKGSYARLIEPTTQAGKEEMFLAEANRYTAQQENFTKIPGMPVAYWVSERFVSAFAKGISIDSISKYTGSQNITANNEKYLRLIWEVCANKIDFNKKWNFYIKGGEFRKWYGNIELVVDWSDNARSFYKTNATSNLLADEYRFREGITYTELTSGVNSFRYLPPIAIFDKKGPCIVDVLHRDYCLAFFNTKVASNFFKVLNPTITLQVKDVKATPLIIDEDKVSIVERITRVCVVEEKADWDSFETSWDFNKHPLI